MLPLAIPTFTGLPQNAVKQIDVYKDVSPTLQNSLTSKISAFDTDLGGIISKSLKALSGIGDKLMSQGLNLETAKSRIQDALGGSRAAISDLSEVLERSITGDMTGVDQGTGYVRGANTLIDSVKLVADGYTRTFSQSGYSNVSGVMGFIRDLSGNQLINTFDLGAQAALIKGVISEVSKWGVPELVDETFGAKWNADKKSYDYSYDDTFRFSVVKRASDDISPSTSLDVIQTLITHGGDTALVADNPSFPLQLLGGYVLPTGCVQGGPFPVDATDPQGTQTTPNYANEGFKLVKILNTLKPNWFYTTRTYKSGVANPAFRTDTVWSLEYLTDASDAAKAVLSTNPDLRDAMLAAPFYKVESGVAMMKAMYPYFVE